MFRDGLVFKLPGIEMQVAQECSGIRSSLVLFITGLVAGAFTLWCLVDMITWSPGWAEYLSVAVKLHGVFWLINGFIIVNFTSTTVYKISNASRD
mgnify:CR=1 FL=1